MPTFEQSIEIEAPVDSVFEFTSRTDYWAQVSPSLADTEVIEETDDGFLLAAVWKMLGMSIDGTLEFEVLEPNEHTLTRFESSSLNGEMHAHLSETTDGTGVVQRFDYAFGDSLVNRALRPVAKRYNERQFKQALQTTKDLVEAQATVEA